MMFDSSSISASFKSDFFHSSCPTSFSQQVPQRSPPRTGLVEECVVSKRRRVAVAAVVKQVLARARVARHRAPVVVLLRRKGAREYHAGVRDASHALRVQIVSRLREADVEQSGRRRRARPRVPRRHGDPAEPRRRLGHSVRYVTRLHGRVTR